MVGFVDAKSLLMAKQYALDDILGELQLWLAREINAARWAQNKHCSEYFEGYADALGDVIMKIEELRRELG